jgi:hypothetical protein
MGDVGGGAAVVFAERQEGAFYRNTANEHNYLQSAVVAAK